MSKDNNKSKRTQIIAFSLITIVVGGGGFLIGWLFDRNWYFNTSPIKTTPDLDGVINEREWMRSSYYNIPFYLDVNNSIDPLVDRANIDGWNYLSVAEDEDNYYVALDLCSDRTNNLEGEWISLGLGNRIPDTSDSELAFYALENYGFEYLIYNVSEDTPVDYFLNYLPESMYYTDVPFVPEYNSYDLVRGWYEGDYTDIWAWDEPDWIYDTENVLIMHSAGYGETSLYGAGDYAIMDFAVNVTEMLPTYNATDLTIYDLDLELTFTANVSASNSFAVYNTTTDKIWFSILEHDSMSVEFDDPLYMSVMKNQTFTADESFEWKQIDFDHTKINATNGMFYFSIVGWNPANATDPTAFEIYINKMSFRVTTNRIVTTRGTTFKSGNYEVAFSYGSSSNCAEEHRMFEFRIAKSEFPIMVEDKLYLNVAGYGTMAMEGTNYWMYPTEQDEGFQSAVMYHYYDTATEFLKLDMSIT